MLFKQRKKLSLIGLIKKYIQASFKPRRSLIYIKHRLLRMPHRTRDIAMGMASGFCVSWTPTFGFHIIQCFVFCLLFRANFPAAVLGSVFGNPWTFPFLMWISYLVGTVFIDVTNFDHFIALKTGFDMNNEESFGMQAFMPTLIGGYIMAVVTFPIIYFTFYYFIEGARKARQVIKEKRKTKK